MNHNLSSEVEAVSCDISRGVLAGSRFAGQAARSVVAIPVDGYVSLVSARKTNMSEAKNTPLESSALCAALRSVH